MKLNSSAINGRRGESGRSLAFSHPCSEIRENALEIRENATGNHQVEFRRISEITSLPKRNTRTSETIPDNNVQVYNRMKKIYKMKCSPSDLGRENGYN